METEMEDFLSIAAVVLILAVVILSIVWQFQRSNSLLQQWAEHNGYRIISQEYRSFFKGPFFWSSKGQTVYYVVVKDSDGNMRRGWVRCGGWFLGLMSNNVEVRWDY